MNARSSKRRSKKVGYRDEDATVVTIDQTRKAVGADLYAAWYPVGERPTVGVSASREGVNLLGAVTEYGETTVLECDGLFTGEVTIRFLEHLQAKFGETLVVLLDKATYFTAGAVKDFAADEPIELMYFPTGSPDLNPTEESLVVHSIDNAGSKSPVSHRSDAEKETKNPTNAAEEPEDIGSDTYSCRGCH